MAEAELLEVGALHFRNGRSEGEPGRLGHSGRESFGHDDGAALEIVRGVVKLGVKGNREVGRNRPRRGRPDDDRHVPSGELRYPLRDLRLALRRQRELDVDRRRDVVGVLDLGFGERSAAVDAPVHRLLAFVDEPLLDEASERPGDGRLIPIVHRQVGCVPGTEDAQPLELFGHRADEALGVGAARAAELGHAHLALFCPELFIDFQLNGQAMAIEPDDVRCVVAGHRFRFDHQLFENLVDGRADVNAAVRVRGAVVEHELGLPRASSAQLSIQVHRVPAGEHLRLGDRQIRLHRKLGPREIEGVFPV